MILKDNVIKPLTILSLLDLTWLVDEIDESELHRFYDKAISYQVAGICLYPKHFSCLNTKNPSIRNISVANFPTGTESFSNIIKPLTKLVNDELIDEVDYVFPYTLYLQGKQAQALAECQK